MIGLEYNTPQQNFTENESLKPAIDQSPEPKPLTASTNST